jgi:hypothetical protein
VLIGALRIADRVRRRLGRTARDGFWLLADAANQAKPILLAISSQMDEAWQVLHYVRSIDNPLAVRSGLLDYLSCRVRSAFSQNRAVARVLGAKSYSDIGNFAKLVTAAMHSLIFLFVIYALYIYYRALVEPGMWGTMFEGIIIALYMVPFFVIALVGLTMLLGESLLSAFGSPFRFCLQVVGSLTTIPREIGTYLIRRKSWSVILEMAMGLEGYQFALPLIDQVPRNIPKNLVAYEDMPKGAEHDALDRRSNWVGRHLKEASETFSKLVVTEAELKSLQRTIEEDQTLVHAAYYTDDECIARIADWIAGTR